MDVLSAIVLIERIQWLIVLQAKNNKTSLPLGKNNESEIQNLS
jgi:hypothetical protein